MADVNRSDERPSKRQRLSPQPDNEATVKQALSTTDDGTATDSTNPTNDPREIEVGITEYASEDVVPFQALLKKRYTDFLVNEILPGGKVVHLTSTAVPQALYPPGASKKRFNKRENHVLEPAATDNVKGSEPNQTSDQNIGPRSTEEDAEAKSEVPIEQLHTSGISDDDKQKLISYLNQEAVEELLDLYKSILAHPTRKPKDHPLVRTQFTSDRSLRGEIHGSIRRIFNSKIDSSTDKNGYLCLTAVSPNTRKPNTSRDDDDRPYYPSKLGWLERGGDYLHFTLYKENKDTMESIGFLVRQMKISAKSFQFAGTKDRRAVTAQRVSAYRLDAEKLSRQNYHLRNAAVGDFEYQKTSLELGDLGGNEFILTLRECVFPGLADPIIENDLTQVQSALYAALTNLRAKGFLNYYGLQRFGTFSTRTDTVGLRILKNDFRSACEAILDYDAAALTATDSEHPSDASSLTVVSQIVPSRDETARATAIQSFNKTGNSHKALEMLPKKFSAENQIMRHLARTPADYIGALLAIPRNLRLMYVHAYQSLVWNKAATNRWKLYGGSVVEGDLVLVHEHKDKEPNSTSNNAEPETSNVDADGEIIVAPAAHDRANQFDDAFERARALTATEAASSQYTIFDVVLPLPGYDILYPVNKSGGFYKEYMGSQEGGGLNPNDMRRRQKDFSLSGGYRKLMARIGEEFSVDVRKYAKDEEQFVMTDLERVKEAEKQREKEKEGEGKGDTEMVDTKEVQGEGQGQGEGEIAGTEVKDKIAAVLRFQLGASQYATMALRELSRGGVTAYKAEIGTAK